jgi:hypothetical protein
MRQIHLIKFSFLKISLSVISLIYLTNSARATESDSLFKSDVIINMELRSDFSAIEADRNTTPVDHEGELVYYTPGGETKRLSVKLTIRGHFRRDTANCNFPPLLVNFKKTEVKNTLFDNQDKLKLVTPCQYEKDIFDEYLIYKMYNKVTDLSLKVRLVRILYYDTRRGKKIFEKYSFFLEEKKHAAERNNGFEKDAYVTPSDWNKENFRRMSIFQYIIGNADWLDWYFKSYHNILLIQPRDTTLSPSPIPYDFDYSGFVNADYTLPKRGSEELSGKRRIYKGLCYSADEFEETFSFYRELRPVFESIINNMELISKGSRKQMINYIGGFYKVIENKKLIKREFLDACETTIAFKIPY